MKPVAAMTIDDLKKFYPGTPGYEWVKNDLYDSAPYRSGHIDFFNLPVGSIDYGGKRKTFSETNMMLHSQIPVENLLLIDRIIVELYQDKISPSDHRKFYNRGNLALHIGNKRYLQSAPMQLFQFRPRVEGYSIEPTSLLLTPLQHFSVQLSGLPKLKNSARVFVRLSGRFRRPEQ